MTVEDLNLLVDYNYWARDRVLEAVGGWHTLPTYNSSQAQNLGSHPSRRQRLSLTTDH